MAGEQRPHGLRDTLEPGVRVGGARFILKRVLGKGECSVVWLARDIKADRDVALKILPDSLRQDANAVEWLKQVFNRTRQLEHPQIARVLEWVEDYQIAAISSEYVQGWSLTALRVDKPEKRYLLEEVTPWVRQLCEALNYAHSNEVIHGGLKSSNLMLNEREELKITDFGLGAALGGAAASRGTSHVTAALGFMSPQQALGAQPSISDDVYSLGATIFDLLTGTPPFYKGQVLAQIRDLPPPSIAERFLELGIKDRVPFVVEDTVKQCLAKDLARRPQSIGEVSQLLERSDASRRIEMDAVRPKGQPAEVLPADAIGSDLGAPASRRRNPSTSRKTLIAAALTVCIAAILACGFWFWRSHGRKTSFATGSVGSLDISFSPNTNSDNEVRAALAQPDGKIVIGGRFTHFGEGEHHGLARLKPDGSLDDSFAASTSGEVHALLLQPDNKIIIGGDFGKVNDSQQRRIARLNPDGSVDDSFNAKAAPNREIRTMLLQPDGKIIAGGNFDQVGGKKLNRIVRFRTDGSRDDSFNPGPAANATVWALAVQSDRKILVAGNFNSFANHRCGKIARLKPNGSFDATFDAGTGANDEIFAMALQPDGKILIGGNFYVINQAERNRIARLNADGTVDTTFEAGAGPNTGVRCLALQSDGKILVGGIFTSFQGAARNRIARLKSDGKLDMAFDPGAGASEVVRCVLQQPDGKVVIGGGFKQVAGWDRPRIARLNGDSARVSK